MPSLIDVGTHCLILSCSVWDVLAVKAAQVFIQGIDLLKGRHGILRIVNTIYFVKNIIQNLIAL